MSMLTAQTENLRIMARLVHDYDYRDISRALREAADTIENLRNRLTGQTCHMVKRYDYIVYGEAPCIWFECDECGGVLPDAFGITVSYCPNCGRQVVE